MRILATTHSLGLNGAALCLFDFLCAIQDAGGRADVLYRGDEPLKQALLERGIGVAEQLALQDYDLALVNTLLDHGNVLEIARALPVLFWVHEGLTLLQTHVHLAPAWTQAFSASSRVVFQSRWQAEQVFKPFLDGVAPHRIERVAPAVSEPIRTAGPVLVSPLLPGQPGQILSIGGVYPRKRTGDLVRAVIDLARQGLDLHCMLVGSLAWLDQNEPHMLEQLRTHAGLFTLTGELPRKQVAACLRQAHVYCSASGDESFSMAVLDAAATGLPLALTDLPGTRDTWLHGVNALLAPPGAVDCLAWNLRALLQDRRLAARLGAQAAATARRFGHDAFLQRMTTVALQAIADPLERAMR